MHLRKSIFCHPIKNTAITDFSVVIICSKIRQATSGFHSGNIAEEEDNRKCISSTRVLKRLYIGSIVNRTTTVFVVFERFCTPTLELSKLPFFAKTQKIVDKILKFRLCPSWFCCCFSSIMPLFCLARIYRQSTFITTLRRPSTSDLKSWGFEAARLRRQQKDKALLLCNKAKQKQDNKQPTPCPFPLWTATHTV